MKKLITSIIIVTLCLLCQVADAQTDHSLWNTLVKKHVSNSGKVDYKGIQKDQGTLTKYLGQLAAKGPTGSDNDQLAYWINAYNAYTVKLVIDHMPVTSIKDIAAKVGTDTPWDYKFANIGGTSYTLNHIEHNIIRAKYNEPRIHFAVNCASESCPKLKNEAYVGQRLEAQLTEQAKAFLSDKTKNNLSSSPIQISELFSWFKDDFTKGGTLISFLNKYSNQKIAASESPSYLTYSWKLNN